jgi:hypothetical protein
MRRLPRCHHVPPDDVDVGVVSFDVPDHVGLEGRVALR